METVTRPETARTTREAAGRCQCGAPVADHFDSQNRKLTCEQARRRERARLDNERSHLELLISVIATIWCARTGRNIVTTPATGTLPESEQRQAHLFAQMVLTCLDPQRRRAARDKAVERGLEEYRGFTGHAELPVRVRAQMRVVLEGALNTYTAALEGLEGLGAPPDVAPDPADDGNVVAFPVPAIQTEVQ